MDDKFDIKIREAKHSDAEDIRNLMYELTEKLPPKEPFEQRLGEILSDKNYRISCCEHEGKVYGIMMGVICKDIYDDLRPFMVIENVIVSENLRGKSIGKQLLADIEAWGKEHNIAYCNIVSSDFRKGAHAFYEKCGYGREAGFRKIF